MYINNDKCIYKIGKDESKCARIFRPWDNKIANSAFKDTAQDSTVSTTTLDEDLGSNIEEKSDKSDLMLAKPSSVDGHIKMNRKSMLKSPVKKNAHHDSTPTSSPKSNIGCNTSKTDHLHSRILSKCSNNTLMMPDSFLQTSSLYSKPCGSILPNPELFMQPNSMPVDIIPDPYNPANADLVQTNLAHHLGLPPNDPLLLESLAQGYALEEYARVLTQEQQAKLMASKKQRPKKYKCPHCDVGFSNNGQLKGHIRIHTGERPFKCDDKDCGKTFTRNEELTRHKRIHSGLRPFPCSHCGKRFGRKDHLKKHSRTHFQPRGLYAVPVVLPFEAWASGQTSGYPFFPMLY